jgi:hypothetical protein
LPSLAFCENIHVCDMFHAVHTDGIKPRLLGYDNMFCRVINIAASAKRWQTLMTQVNITLRLLCETRLEARTVSVNALTFPAIDVALVLKLWKEDGNSDPYAAVRPLVR